MTHQLSDLFQITLGIGEIAPERVSQLVRPDQFVQPGPPCAGGRQLVGGVRAHRRATRFAEQHERRRQVAGSAPASPARRPP
jgi:hypothetical protein